jgi:hypothetical protein
VRSFSCCANLQPARLQSNIPTVHAQESLVLLLMLPQVGSMCHMFQWLRWQSSMQMQHLCPNSSLKQPRNTVTRGLVVSRCGSHTLGNQLLTVESRQAHLGVAPKPSCHGCKPRCAPGSCCLLHQHNAGVLDLGQLLRHTRMRITCLRDAKLQWLRVAKLQSSSKMRSCSLLCGALGGKE